MVEGPVLLHEQDEVLDVAKRSDACRIMIERAIDHLRGDVGRGRYAGNTAQGKEGSAGQSDVLRSITHSSTVHVHPLLGLTAARQVDEIRVHRRSYVLADPAFDTG